MLVPTEVVRKYVLNCLEDGTYTEGMRLPGSRKISEKLNISRTVVQKALNTLVNEGILKAALRSGLYVEEDWRYRRIQSSLRIYTQKKLPWLPMFRAKLNRELPQLHISTEFSECPFEIITTSPAQARHDEFIDLMPILKKCYPDLNLFHTELLTPFIRDGRLTALPFLFSPRIIACNRRMLAEAGCPEPSQKWTLDDLMDLADRLGKHFPPEKIFDWSPDVFLWMNFILACGGRLFDPDAADPVKFDSPEAKKGLKYFRSLRSVRPDPGKQESFCALSVISRQIYALKLHKTLENEFLFLPFPGDSPKRSGSSIQATELFAIRRDGVDHGISEPIIRFLWSEKFQDHLAELRYGIPIRKSSAKKAFSAGNPADAVFKQACSRICSNYQLYNSSLESFITGGIRKILNGDGNIDRELSQLAQGVRLYISYADIG